MRLELLVGSLFRVVWFVVCDLVVVCLIFYERMLVVWLLVMVGSWVCLLLWFKISDCWSVDVEYFWVRFIDYDFDWKMLGNVDLVNRMRYFW